MPNNTKTHQTPQLAKSLAKSPIIVALDFNDAQTAIAFARQLDPEVVRLKVGKELFVTAGPAVVEQLQALGFEIFLDLKFHDIPNTVAQACLAAAELGVWMTNVHAGGGAPMMQEVMARLNKRARRPLITAVTVLTSMNSDTLRRIGIERDLQAQVSHLAALAKDSGLDGIVCSAQEAKQLKQQLGPDFLLVTPGIRLANTGSTDGSTTGNDDQQRIMTPKHALSVGSDYLVIGRPITQAADPVQAVADIVKSLTLYS